MPLTYRILVLLLLISSRPAYATAFTVTSNADSGPGSLREAIQNAATNGTATPDIINFNIPYTDINSITIQLQSTLPEISANLTIDASTQPSPMLGVSNSRIILQPQGGNNYITMLDACMSIHNADNVQLYGLCIKLFSEFSLGGTLHEPTAISLWNANNLVFGAPGKGNVIAGCSYGLFKAYSTGTVNNIKVQSNFFGLDVDGTTKLLPNFSFTNLVAVELTLSSNALIGGSTEAEGNVFSGVVSGVSFIEMKGYCEVANNKFSTDYTGNIGMGNGAMGGRDSQADFFIHDNTISGEVDFNSMSGRFLVTHNFWGTNPAQTAQFGNGILDFNNCTGAALIGGNDASVMNVFGNGVLGVGNNNSKKITVLHNSFYCHDEDGIYMNWYTLPNKPFITINKITASTAEGIARPNSIIEVYQTDNCRHCEGKTFITRLNADAAGKWTYTGAVTGNITATATNVDDSTTSAFAQPLIDVSRAVITDATCNKANGKITGIKITSGTSFTWTDINGKVVGTDTSLLNIPAGQYQLTVGIGNNTCKAVSQLFIVGNTSPPQINNAAFKIAQPACGASNGQIIFQQFHSPATTIWTDENGDIIQQGNDTLKNAGEGTYFLTLVLPTNNTCTTISAPLVLINQSGPSVNIVPAKVIPATCGKPVGSITNVSFTNITGTPVYHWYDSNNKLVGTGADLINVPAGAYHLAFKDGSTCDTIITATIQVPAAGSIRFDSTAKNIVASSCTAITGGINGVLVTNGFNYLWKDTVSKQIVSSSNDLVNVPPGYYKLIATSVEGCSDSTVTWQVPQAMPEVFQSTVTISPENCGKKNGSAVLKQLNAAQTGFGFSWTDNNNPNQVLSTSLSLQNTAAGNYTCYSTDPNGCVSVAANISIINLPAPVINDNAAVINPNVCNQQNGAISQINISGSGPFSYKWYTASGQEIAQTKDLSGLAQGNYYMVVNDAGNCTDTSNMFIISNTVEDIAAPQYSDIIVLKGNSATLQVKNLQTGKYGLYASGTAVTPSQENTNGSFTTGAINNDTAVCIVLKKGDCASLAAKVNIKVAITLDINMPNAFSPNHDGNNDLFRIKYPDFIKTIDFTVFNRWGQKIFYTSNAATGWDGTINGQLQPAGDYLWVINYTDVLGNSKKLSGYVLLLR